MASDNEYDNIPIISTWNLFEIAYMCWDSCPSGIFWKSSIAYYGRRNTAEQENQSRSFRVRVQDCLKAMAIIFVELIQVSVSNLIKLYVAHSLFLSLSLSLSLSLGVQSWCVWVRFERVILSRDLDVRFRGFLFPKDLSVEFENQITSPFWNLRMWRRYASEMYIHIDKIRKVRVIYRDLDIRFRGFLFPKDLCVEFENQVTSPFWNLRMWRRCIDWERERGRGVVVVNGRFYKDRRLFWSFFFSFRGEISRSIEKRDISKFENHLPDPKISRCEIWFNKQHSHNTIQQTTFTQYR